MVPSIIIVRATSIFKSYIYYTIFYIKLQLFWFFNIFYLFFPLGYGLDIFVRPAI